MHKWYLIINYVPQKCYILTTYLSTFRPVFQKNSHPSGQFFKKILIIHIAYSHVDSNQNTETFKLPEPENVDDAFGDDDDAFDLLLSQIDTTEAVQSSSTFTILSKKTLHQSNGVPPKSTLELPTTSKGTYFFF